VVFAALQANQVRLKEVVPLKLNLVCAVIQIVLAVVAILLAH
jgi:hypothetical protein